MELDDFKNIWQTSQQRDIYQQNVDNESVVLMIKQKSKAVSDKLRRNLDIDMTVSSLFIPPLLYVILWSDFAIYHKFVAVFFLIYTVLSLLYYRKIIRLYQEIELRNDLFSTLKFTIEQFSKQVKTLTLYNQITVVPVMFYGTVVGNELISWWRDNSSITLLEMIISTIIITPIGYFYMKYIINVFYGNHLRKLKQHLAELENEE
jgi:hypothetical protein